MFMSIFLFVFVFEHVHHYHGQSYVLLVQFSRFSLSVGWWVYITVTMLNSNVIYTVYLVNLQTILNKRGPWCQKWCQRHIV